MADVRAAGGTDVTAGSAGAGGGASLSSAMLLRVLAKQGCLELNRMLPPPRLASKWLPHARPRLALSMLTAVSCETRTQPPPFDTFATPRRSAGGPPRPSLA